MSSFTGNKQVYLKFAYFSADIQKLIRKQNKGILITLVSKISWSAALQYKPKPH